jgi:hypothetical protein
MVGGSVPKPARENRNDEILDEFSSDIFGDIAESS